MSPTLMGPSDVAVRATSNATARQRWRERYSRAARRVGSAFGGRVERRIERHLLERAWLHAQPKRLQVYLVRSYQNPVINVQSLLARHEVIKQSHGASPATAPTSRVCTSARCSPSATASTTTTTGAPGRSSPVTKRGERMDSSAVRPHPPFGVLRCSPDRIRTGATALRGRRARPLHNGAMWLAPQI